MFLKHTHKPLLQELSAVQGVTVTKTLETREAR